VVALHCSEDLLVELTTTTFDLAAARQRPPVGLIHHSDRGSQYAAAPRQEFAVAEKGAADHWGLSNNSRPLERQIYKQLVISIE
jgi:transposase InsO family protein